MTKRTRIFMAGSAAVMAAGLCTGLIAYYGGGLAALNASTGPTELAYVPADATVVAYADVRSIMDSELRQQLKAAVPEMPDGQEEFKAKTGIDIERDLDYVVAAMTSLPGENQMPNGLLVARGQFNVGTLQQLATDHGGTLEEYRGKTLVTSPADAGGDQVTLAFLEFGLVAVGKATAVKHAIDAQMSGKSITGNDEMMNLVRDIAAQNNAWAVGRFDVLTSQANLPAEISSRIPPVKWFAAAGHVNGGVSGTLRAEARDEQSAQQLRDVVRGFLALVQMQGQTDPKLTALANSLQLSGDGTTVALSFTLPAEFLQLIAPKQPVQQ
jgi:hypothetical protein